LNDGLHTNAAQLAVSLTILTLRAMLQIIGLQHRAIESITALQTNHYFKSCCSRHQMNNSFRNINNSSMFKTCYSSGSTIDKAFDMSLERGGGIEAMAFSALSPIFLFRFSKKFCNVVFRI